MEAPSPKHEFSDPDGAMRSILRIADRLLAQAGRPAEGETPLRARVTAVVGVAGGVAVFAAVLATSEESAIGIRLASHGLGLGVSIVHGIVQEHDASIEVASELGRGTRFDVRFPGDAPPSVP